MNESFSSVSARQTVVRPTATGSRARNSSSVASECSRTRRRNNSACSANAFFTVFGRDERAVVSPVSRRRCFNRRIHDSLTRYFVAAVRVVTPPSQSSNIRRRKSIE